MRQRASRGPLCSEPCTARGCPTSSCSPPPPRTRAYLGVHYPFDVLAGAAIGAAVSLAALAALRFRRRTSAVPRHQKQRRHQADPETDGAPDRRVVVGKVDELHEHEHGAERAEAGPRSPCRSGCSAAARSRSPERQQREHGETDEEDELAKHAAVPAERESDVSSLAKLPIETEYQPMKELSARTRPRATRAPRRCS